MLSLLSATFQIFKQRYNQVPHNVIWNTRYPNKKNKQRRMCNKLVKAICPVNTVYINSLGRIYCELIWIIALFVPRYVVLDCKSQKDYKHIKSATLTNQKAHVCIAHRTKGNNVYIKCKLDKRHKNT